MFADLDEHELEKISDCFNPKSVKKTTFCYAKEMYAKNFISYIQVVSGLFSLTKTDTKKQGM